jgi:Ser/Thr protein kinase RdoA (MazF antagonist)
MSEPSRAPAQSVGTADLCAALEHVLRDYFAAPRRIVELDRRSAASRSSFALEELDAKLDDGTTLQLMFKNVSWHGLLERARSVKPAFLYDPLREIEAYRSILAPRRLGPTCYGAVIDDRIGRYWLFLERAPGLELYQVDLAVWRQVARWLAAMHTSLGAQAESPTRAQSAHLLSYDADFFRVWLRRAQTFLQQIEASQSGADQRGIEWLAERYDQVVERLAALPVTMIHGEFYASNVLVQQTAGDLRVCPVDWEMAGVGPGLIDLAALIAGGWTEEEKSSLALTYYEARPFDSGWSPASDEFLAALDCCRLHLAVQWLGWAPEWSPPPEHAQNWLGEALCLAEQLGL